MTLRVINGGGDIVSLLEGLTERAKAGEFKAVVVCLLDQDGMMFGNFAYLDELPAPWLQMVATVAHVQHNFMIEGL
jgi:hypothetical protein